MSYFGYYKYNPGQISFEETSMKGLVDVSIEGLSFKKMFEVLGNVLKSIKDLFLKMFKWIKDKILKFLKLDKTVKTADITKLLDSYKIISDKDLTEKIVEFYETNGGALSLNNKISMKLTGQDRNRIVLAFFLFNSSGEVIDFEQLLDWTEKLSNVIKTSDDYDRLESGSLNLMIEYLKVNGYDPHDPELVNKYKGRMFTSSGVFKYLDNLHQMANKLESYYKTKEREVSGDIKKLEQELERLKKDGNDSFNSKEYRDTYAKLNCYYNYVKAVATPSKLMLEYIRLLGFINEKFASEEYTTTADLNPSSLYHISIDDNLGKKWYKPFSKRGLNPRAPNSGFLQLLPKRICFAPEVELCFYGAPFIFEKSYNRNIKDIDDKYSETTVTLYKGIPDKDTRYLKPELITAGVGESMFSKEIAVTTPIKLERVGKIKIKFARNADWLDPSKFDGYTNVE